MCQIDSMQVPHHDKVYGIACFFSWNIHKTISTDPCAGNVKEDYELEFPHLSMTNKILNSFGFFSFYPFPV